MPLFKRKSSPRPSAPSPAPRAASQGGLEPRIREIGGEFLERARAHKAGLLSARFYQDKLMDWSMKDHEFKVQLFRFVDTFPVLRTPEAVHSHLADYLSQPGVKLPPGLDLGLRAGGAAKGLMTRTISGQIEGMAGNFIAGTDAASALPNLRRLWKSGIAFSVDLLGEACLSHAEADAYRDKYLDLVSNLPEQVATWEANPRLERDHLGPIARTNVSVKISSLSPVCDPIDTEGAIRDVLSRLRPILEAAKARGVFVNFDMEQFALKDLTLELFMRACEEIDFEAGLAMQAYLRSGPDDARRLAEWAKRTGRIVTVRLVKGAYWDYETIHAEQMGWPCPVWNEKWETDRNFEAMTDILLDAMPAKPAGAAPSPRALAAAAPGSGGIKLALGSHNVRSIAHALAGLEKRGLPREAIELQMLHGMADQLKHAAAEMGLRVREYVPVGEMIPGMAYLVRRLLENTSNESWLKAGFLDNANADVLLAPPAPRGDAADDRGGSAAGVAAPYPAPIGGALGEQKLEGAPATPERRGAGAAGSAPRSRKRDLFEIAPERHALSPAVPGVGDGRPFFSEPYRDFSRRSVREAFAAAVARASVPRIPSDRTPEQAAEMVARAHAAFEAWRDFDPIGRADVLVRAAAKMRAQRDTLAGVMIKEAGKPWKEADADVCEAIDFCEYYARLAPQLFARQRLGRFIGELDELWYQPRGVCAVISPWNFPLAIIIGMSVAALVTGNTVVVKPAEQTTGIASIMFDILDAALREAGAPRDVLHYCPAPGETTGAALVRDPRVAIIAFTGSKSVGLEIIRTAGTTAPEQEFVKKVVCEMGGKNAIIVDQSADLDEAVLGVRYSAFGYQGQKCSACSRVIVVDPEGPAGPHISTFTERLVEASRALIVKDPTEPGADLGPVIDDQAAAKIRHYIDLAQKEGCRLLLGQADFEVPSVPSPSGTIPANYIAPHIFAGVTPEHAIARDEIFGPVLAVMHAGTFEEALRIANATPYKLTGGVFTRKPAHIDRARRDFRVGNLYINRGCTGALVARQPFGGFGMSGVGSKAGGPDYLHQFVEPRACCENTMRRGFAPEL